MEAKSWTCDCGCGTVVGQDYQRCDWLVLSQHKGDRRTTGAQLLREFHFVDLFHLATWAKERIPKIEDLIRNQDLHGIEPKGGVYLRDYPDITT